MHDLLEDVKSMSDAQETDSEHPLLFIVWVDDNMGFGRPNWEWNSPPKPLNFCLVEAQETRKSGFPTQIWPESQSPRPDGRNYPYYGDGLD